MEILSISNNILLLLQPRYTYPVMFRIFYTVIYFHERLLPFDIIGRRRYYATGGTSIGGGVFRKPFHRDVDGRNGRLVKQSPVLESEPTNISFFLSSTRSIVNRR